MGASQAGSFQDRDAGGLVAAGKTKENPVRNQASLPHAKASAKVLDAVNKVSRASTSSS
jgi:hypothetical protein